MSPRATFPSPRRRSQRLRATPGWLASVSLTLLCLLGHLELHKDHALMANDRASSALTSGCHSELGSHFEPPQDPGHRDCPACRLRLIARSLEARAEVAYEPREERLPAARVELAGTLNLPTPSSRGPPLVL